VPSNDAARAHGNMQTREDMGKIVMGLEACFNTFLTGKKMRLRHPCLKRACLFFFFLP